MSVKPDADNFAWGIFHRTWITHSLTTVLLVTGVTYIVFADLLHAGPMTMYMTIAMLSATLSHVLLDSMTKGGVPLLGPVRRQKAGPAMVQGQQYIPELGVPYQAGLAMAGDLLRAHPAIARSFVICRIR